MDIAGLVIFSSAPSTVYCIDILRSQEKTRPSSVVIQFRIRCYVALIQYHSFKLLLELIVAFFASSIKMMVSVSDNANPTDYFFVIDL